ncbi:hypothetical protein K4A83_17085 [Spirulina subsalsa FACHB-351]|uniref:Uncharacterized protein n=1 Tax=Spirulina subsalsa FACHB-351 TaxID=234711 RepID=A0ABT3LAG8_9CYAN|nr:hypothetical protein [Spirulina subsalsa]MCW6037975.1 hypothetical protein [Spirulina subsalsa FACHB-351]
MTMNTLMTAFLATLVTSPEEETIPSLDATLWKDNPDAFFRAAQQAIPNPSFWDRYKTFHRQLVAGYTIQRRNKIMRSRVSPESSDTAANSEETNVALSAEEIIGSPTPDQKARESLAASGLDPLSWAAGVTGWQP